jgi:DNA-binding transcriptional MerR regulator
VTSKIGAIAQRLGTTVRTLRFYEEQGLVHPRRSPGGTRVYEKEDETRFAACLALTNLGLPLERLVELATVRPKSKTGDEASQEVSRQLRSMDEELEAWSRDIADQRKDIRRAQRFLEGCQGCDKQPVRSVCDKCEHSSRRKGISLMRVVWDEREPD